MLRTKASTYAILAVTEIAKRQSTPDAGVQAGDVARSLNLPAAYAAKVLTQLARANILRSDRGPRGGFRLFKPADSIDLLEIIEAVDGAIAAEVGLGGGLIEPTRSMRLVDQIFHGVASQIREVLRRETIADLIRAEQPVSAFSQASS
jgi:Rrf2 family protein